MLGELARRLRARWAGWHLHAVPETAFGECPRWTADGTAVWWVDIPRGHLNRTTMRATGDTVACALGGEIAALALDGEGNPWAVVDGILMRLTVEGAVAQRYQSIAGMDAAVCRANDAAWGPDGRLWITTMARDGASPAGGVVAFHPARGFEWLLDGLPIGNGPAFDVSRGRAYLADSTRRTVLSVPVTQPHVRTPHLVLEPDEGVPDGLAVDERGRLWVAHHGGGCLSVWSDAGTREQTIRTPCRCPTAVALHQLPDGTLMVAVTSAPQRGEQAGLWVLRYGSG